MMTIFPNGKNKPTFCLGRHRGNRITCGMEAGQPHCVPRRSVHVRPSVRSLSLGRDSSMTVIGVIKTTQQPFSSSPSSLPPSRCNRYPNGTGSCVRRCAASHEIYYARKEGKRGRRKAREEKHLFIDFNFNAGISSSSSSTKSALPCGVY